jgi:hypothetical protein
MSQTGLTWGASWCDPVSFASPVSPPDHMRVSLLGAELESTCEDVLVGIDEQSGMRRVQ